MQRTFNTLAREDAETIALQALAFLASEESRLSHFIAQTGITLEDLHVRANEPDVLRAALDILTQDEPNLLMFAANAGLDAERVVQAHATLEGPHERSI
ncbi:MAG TPA: DUF3572 domain-containing protein [Hyphomicrobiaceae bacterium]|nr:DUF3572 domain-containing protein [Hyphomicrobiaceae bacterium]